MLLRRRQAEATSPSSPARRAPGSGDELNLIDKDRFKFCWIVDFPMYEWNEDEKKIDFSHNPFSMPQIDREEFLALDPNDKDTILGIKAYPVRHRLQRHRAVVGRDPQPRSRRDAEGVRDRRLSREDVLEAKFGGMLNAFRYGAPPHGGIAPGIDRIVMLLGGEENLREVIMFPMNQRARTC